MGAKGNDQGFIVDIFRKAVKTSLGIQNSFVEVKIFDAIVKSGSQNETEFTCVVDSVDGTLNGLIVRYHLYADDGEVNIPADDSLVTIASTLVTDPYIVKDTELKKRIVSIGRQVFSNDGVIQSFDYYKDIGEPSGSFGGFIKVKDPTDSEKGLLKKINNLEEQLNKLSGKWNDFCNLYVPGSPTVTGLPATLATSLVLPDLVTTTESDLTNPHIIHGLSNLSS